MTDTLVIDTEDTTQENKYVCSCGHTCKTRSGLAKHKKKCKELSENPELKGLKNMFDSGKNVEPEQKDQPKDQPKPQAPSAQEQAYLQQELIALYINNPTIRLDKPINLDYLNLIGAMSAEELKMRILEIKQNLSTKLDRRYSDCGIRAASFFVGSILGIADELQSVNARDELLGCSAQEVLSFRLGLFALPAEVKTMGLFTLNAVDTKINIMRKNREEAAKKAEQDKKNPIPQPAPQQKKEIKQSEALKEAIKSNPKLVANDTPSFFE